VKNITLFFILDWSGSHGSNLEHEGVLPVTVGLLLAI